jgi:hypothetical protein
MGPLARQIEIVFDGGARGFSMNIELDPINVSWNLER